MLAGDFDQWAERLQDIESRAVTCIAAAWPRVRQGISSISIENEINRTLAYWLQKDNAATSIGAIRCLYEMPDLDIDANQKVFVSGRTDLRFQIGSDPDCDLVFECKRLRVTYPSGFKNQADKYVSDGLERFPTGKYSKGASLAGMLGYVMDGNAPTAAVDVQREITKQGAEMSLVSGGLVALPTVSSHLRLLSLHSRAGRSNIEVRHTFLAV